MNGYEVNVKVDGDWVSEDPPEPIGLAAREATEFSVPDYAHSDALHTHRGGRSILRHHEADDWTQMYENDNTDHHRFQRAYWLDTTDPMHHNCIPHDDDLRERQFRSVVLVPSDIPIENGNEAAVLAHRRASHVAADLLGWERMGGITDARFNEGQDWAAQREAITLLGLPQVLRMVVDEISRADHLAGKVITIGRVMTVAHDSPESGGMRTAYLQPYGMGAMSIGVNNGRPDWESSYLSEQIVLAYTFAPDDVATGDILVLAMDEWVGVGHVLDPVRTTSPTENAEILHLPVNGTWADMVELEAQMTVSETEDISKWTRCYGEDETTGCRLFRSRAEATSYVRAKATMLSYISDGVVGTTDPIENDDAPVVFVPTFKDKRPQMLFDRATPQFALFHDEIRCASCNGRVLVKLAKGNEEVEAACPHCGATPPDALRFAHLISPEEVEVIAPAGDE